MHALPGSKKECLILLDWAAKLRAELVAFKHRRGCGKERASIEMVVAYKLVGPAVKFIGSSLGHCVDGGAAITSEFG